MGKSRGSKRGTSTTHYNYTATPRVLGPSLSSLVLQSPSWVPLIEDEVESIHEVQDRRRFDVDPIKPAKRATGYPARLRAFHNAPLQAIGFQDPKRVLICVRRKTRRQVLFAFRRTRKGAGGAKRRNYYSNVRC